MVASGCTRTRFAFAVVFLLAFAFARAAFAVEQGKPVELELTVAVGPAFALGKAAQAWARLVTERSAGALEVKVVPGANLAGRDPERELAALREGRADLAVGSSLVWSREVKPLAVPSLPWIAPSLVQLQALARGDVGERLLAAVGEAGVKGIALAPLGHRELATVDKAVREPADLAGMRVRVQSYPLLQDLYASLGAKPVAMTAAAAREAFARAELEGQEGSPMTFVAARLDTMGVKHVTLLGATGELAVFAMNRQRWDALTQAQRDLIAAAAREVADDMPATVSAETQSALSTLRSRGVAVTRLLPAAYGPFASAVQAMTDRWTADIGADRVAAARAASAAAAPR